MHPNPRDEETGLPGVRTWRAVYVLVVAVSILWVGLLLGLMRMFP
jgi:hypothetical protein